MPGADRDPALALAGGRWVKLICGASNQDLVAVEDLAGLYALAGVHCIDVAADAAVVAAARRGIAWARSLAGPELSGAGPWLMVSLSDGDDPHFRKAWFDPRLCPPTCPRPCERVCPALAIVPASADGTQPAGCSGVVIERCYGCGRCLPACPHGLIEERRQVLAPEAVAPLLAQLRPDAVELHTQLGRGEAFAARVRQLQEAALPLQRLAVSCGLEGAGPGVAVTPAALAGELWGRHQVLRAAGFRPLWQLDGRPMSGDVGDGTAHAAIRLLAATGAALPPGPVQLAGGTNGQTWPLLQARPHLQRRVAGVAFGGIARRQLQRLLQEAEHQGARLLDLPPLRHRALALVTPLLRPWLQRGDRAAG